MMLFSHVVHHVAADVAFQVAGEGVDEASACSLACPSDVWRDVAVASSEQRVVGSRWFGRQHIYGSGGNRAIVERISKVLLVH